MVKSVREFIGYLWDFKEKKIERIFKDARHPFAKVQDAVERERELRHQKGGKNGKRLL
jgi:hypothetical protein